MESALVICFKCAACVLQAVVSVEVDFSVFDRNVNAMKAGLVLADGCGEGRDEKLVGDCREVAE